jgi:hypothetical protein
MKEEIARRYDVVYKSKLLLQRSYLDAVQMYNANDISFRDNVYASPADTGHVSFRE